MTNYTYLGPLDIAQFGGHITLQGRDISIPEKLLQRGEVIDLDDEYATWVMTRGLRLQRVEQHQQAATQAQEQPQEHDHAQAESGGSESHN